MDEGGGLGSADDLGNEAFESGEDFVAGHSALDCKIRPQEYFYSRLRDREKVVCAPSKRRESFVIRIENDTENSPNPSMKYLMAILLPPMAVIGCGMILSGIVNAVLWAGAIVLLLSSLAWFVFLQTPVMIFLIGALVLWVAASSHAVFVLRSDDEARSLEAEEAILAQQMDLMRRAATHRTPAHGGGQRPPGADGESKSSAGSPSLQLAATEGATLEKIVRDECWLEGERRGCAVNPDDPVISARVAEIIRASDRASLPHKQKS